MFGVEEISPEVAGERLLRKFGTYLQNCVKRD
jgi:hypothetical protein